uniref:Secreted protein n=1 Tax=Rhipicephalus appendiculatus TaxID=34631 RepID=A0A131YBX1_RHIAP
MLGKHLCLPLIAIIIVPLLTSAHRLQHCTHIAAESRAATRASFATAYLCGRPRKLKGRAHYHLPTLYLLAPPATADATETVPSLMYIRSAHAPAFI